MNIKLLKSSVPHFKKNDKYLVYSTRIQLVLNCVAMKKKKNKNKTEWAIGI